MAFAVNLKLIWQQLQQQLDYWSFSTPQQQALLEDIAALLEDGVPAKQALEIYQTINTGVERKVARSVLTRISQGRHLADGLTGWYPAHIVEVIRAGEEGGALAKTMQVSAASLSKRENAFASLLSSLSYPMVVICAALGVSVFINHSIFNSFRTIRPVEFWPQNAQTIVGVADFVQHWWWFLIVVVLLLTFLTVQMMRAYIGPGRTLLDRAPVFSLYRKIIAARFMELMGLLIGNGVVFKRALKIVEYRAEPYLADHLLRMEYRLGSGKENIADVLNTGLLEESDLARLRLVARTKGFEYALVRQGQRSADQNAQAIKVTGRLLGGSLLALVALYAMYLITAVYGVGMFVAT